MDKVIFFDNGDQFTDLCSGQTYFDFLDYAFSKTDYFMLVYANYHGKGYTKTMKLFKAALHPYKVKSRTTPGWPGTLRTHALNTSYKVIFYQNTIEAKEILKKVSCLSDWSRPSYPQDLAFFKGNQCWFYSVGHEQIGAIIHASDEDLSFVEALGLASRKNAYIPKDNYFDAYDEILSR